MAEEEKEKNPFYGKSWSNHSTHNTHAAALVIKESLESDELQVKIRRTAEETFRIKTRSTVVAQAKSKKVTTGKERPKTRSGRRAERERRKKSHKS